MVGLTWETMSDNVRLQVLHDARWCQPETELLLGGRQAGRSFLESSLTLRREYVAARRAVNPPDPLATTSWDCTMRCKQYLQTIYARVLLQFHHIAPILVLEQEQHNANKAYDASHPAFTLTIRSRLSA